MMVQREMSYKMAEEHPPPSITKTAFYRSEDPISNLRIKVKFRCLRESAPSNTDAAPATDESAAPQQPAQTENAIIERIIGWQQKIADETVFTYIGMLCYMPFVQFCLQIVIDGTTPREYHSR